MRMLYEEIARADTQSLPDGSSGTQLYRTTTKRYEARTQRRRRGAPIAKHLGIHTRSGLYVDASPAAVRNEMNESRFYDATSEKTGKCDRERSGN